MRVTNRMLFDIPPSEPSTQARLTVFKKALGILTIRGKGMRREDHPWLALLPFDDDKGKDIGDIMARRCRLYDDAGFLATGTGELSAVRTLCEQRKIEGCP